MPIVPPGMTVPPFATEPPIEPCPRKVPALRTLTSPPSDALSWPSSPTIRVPADTIVLPAKAWLSALTIVVPTPC